MNNNQILSTWGGDMFQAEIFMGCIGWQGSRAICAILFTNFFSFSPQASLGIHKSQKFFVKSFGLAQFQLILGVRVVADLLIYVVPAGG